MSVRASPFLCQHGLARAKMEKSAGRRTSPLYNYAREVTLSFMDMFIALTYLQMLLRDTS